MRTRSRLRRSTSTSTHQSVGFQPPVSSTQSSTSEIKSDPQLDLQAQYQQARRFGHRFTDLSPTTQTPGWLQTRRGGVLGEMLGGQRGDRSGGEGISFSVGNLDLTVGAERTEEGRQVSVSGSYDDRFDFSLGRERHQDGSQRTTFSGQGEEGSVGIEREQGEDGRSTSITGQRGESDLSLESQQSEQERSLAVAADRQNQVGGSLELTEGPAGRGFKAAGFKGDGNLSVAAQQGPAGQSLQIEGDKADQGGGSLEIEQGEDSQRIKATAQKGQLEASIEKTRRPEGESLSASVQNGDQAGVSLEREQTEQGERTQISGQLAEKSAEIEKESQGEQESFSASVAGEQGSLGLERQQGPEGQRLGISGQSGDTTVTAEREQTSEGQTGTLSVEKGDQFDLSITRTQPAETSMPQAEGRGIDPGHVDFAPSRPDKPMFITSEERGSRLPRESILGSLGDGLVLFQDAGDRQAPDPQASDHQKSDRGGPAGRAEQQEQPGGGLGGEEQGAQADPIQQIPPEEVAIMEEQRRQESRQVLAQFMAQGNQRLDQVNELGRTLAPRISAEAAQADRAVDAAMESNRTQVINAVTQAKGQARAQAAGAKAEVIGLHRSTLNSIQQSTAQERRQIEAEYQQASQALSQTQTDTITGITQEFAQAEISARGAGQTVGAEAMAQAQARSNQFAAEPLPQRNAVSDFFNSGFDSGSYDRNRRTAKVDAALQVGQSYQQEIVNSANDYASQIGSSQGDLIQGVQDKIAQAQAQLQGKRSAALAQLQQAEQASRMAANAARQSQLQVIDQTLTTTLGSLDQIQSTQLQQIGQTGQGQKQLIQQTRGEAIAGLQQGIDHSTRSIQQLLQAMTAQARGMEAPDPEGLRAGLGGTLEQIDSVATDSRAAVEAGIGTSTQGLGALGQEAERSLAQIGQSTPELTGETDREFTTRLDQTRSGASQLFQTLQSQHQSQVGSISNQASTDIQGVVSDTDRACQNSRQGLNGQLQGAVQNLETQLRGSLSQLDSDMTTKANEAADRVQPAWSGWVKILIDVVVTIAVGAAIAALVGTLGPVGLALAALAIGAAGGAVKELAKQGVDIAAGTRDGIAWGDVAIEAVVGAIDGLISAATGGIVKVPGLSGLSDKAFDVVGKSLLKKGASHLVSTAGATASKVLVNTGLDASKDVIKGSTKRLLKGEEVSLSTMIQDANVQGNLIGNTAVGLGTAKSNYKKIQGHKQALDQPSNILDPTTGRPFGAKPDSPTLLGPDGRPIKGDTPDTPVGADGRPISGDVADRPSSLLGPDGRPLNGQAPDTPTLVGPDGRPLTGTTPDAPHRPALVGPDGRPISGDTPDVPTLVGPDGAPLQSPPRWTDKKGKALDADGVIPIWDGDTYRLGLNQAEFNKKLVEGAYKRGGKDILYEQFLADQSNASSSSEPTPAPEIDAGQPVQYMMMPDGTVVVVPANPQVAVP